MYLYQLCHVCMFDCKRDSLHYECFRYDRKCKNNEGTFDVLLDVLHDGVDMEQLVVRVCLI